MFSIVSCAVRLNFNFASKSLEGSVSYTLSSSTPLPSSFRVSTTSNQEIQSVTYTPSDGAPLTANATKESTYVMASFSSSLGTQGVLHCNFVSSVSPNYYSGNYFVFFSGDRAHLDVATLFPVIQSESISTVFVVTLTIPAEYSAIANSQIATEVTETEGGAKVVSFEPTPVLLWNQLGLVVGPFQSMRPMTSKAGVQLRTLVPEGCDLTHTRTALDAIQKALDSLCDTFQAQMVIPKKIDVIAVPLEQVPGRGHWGIVPLPNDFVLVRESTSLLTRQKLTLRVVRDTARHWFGANCYGENPEEIAYIDGIARYIEYSLVDVAYKWNTWIHFITSVLEPVRRGSKRKDYWMAAMLRMVNEFIGEKMLMLCLNEFIVQRTTSKVDVRALWVIIQAKGTELGLGVDFNVLANALSIESGSHPLLYATAGSPKGLEIIQLASPNYRRGIIPQLIAIRGGRGMASPSNASRLAISPVEVGINVNKVNPDGPFMFDPASMDRGTITIPVKVMEFRKEETVASKTVVVNVDAQISTPRPDSSAIFLLNERHSGLLRVDYSTSCWEKIFQIRMVLKATEKVGLVVDLGALRLYHIGVVAEGEVDRSTLFLRYLMESHEEEKNCMVWHAVGNEIYSLLCLTQEATCGELLRKFVRRIYSTYCPAPPQFNASDPSVFDYNPNKVIPNFVAAGILRNLALSGDLDVVHDATNYVNTVMNLFTSETASHTEAWDYDLFGVALGIALSSGDGDEELQIYFNVYSLLQVLAPNIPPLVPEDFENFSPAPIKFKPEALTSLVVHRSKLRRACLSGLFSATDNQLLKLTINLLLSNTIDMVDFEFCTDTFASNTRLLAEYVRSLPEELTPRHHAYLSAMLEHDDKISSPAVLGALRFRTDIAHLYMRSAESVMWLLQWVEYAGSKMSEYITSTGCVTFESHAGPRDSLMPTSYM